MVTSGLSIKLFDFQEKAVIKLIDLTSKKDSKQTIIMKAPTGSGKTIILIDYVDTYLTNVSASTAFIWLCPGKGNLEEQSREKMMKFAPGRATQNLFDALLNGFTPGSTTFINWELVTKRGNTAIRDSERKNLFDRIADAHRAGVEFIVIIDEEHSNNTAKAKTIIDAFASKNIVRVSATAIENKRYEFFEIDEVDVIGAAGYQFGDEIIGHALYGEYVRTDMVAESTTYYTTRKRVNTHKHGIELLHSVDTIKSTIGMQSAKVKTILERLFRRGGSSYKKLLLLDTSEFYAFIINNEHRLKEEFREVTACMNTQMTLPLNPKKSIFHIPEQDFYKYDPGVKNEVEYLTNAYHDYTSGYATSLVRSTSEMLFEQFCESRDDIEWVYKNGDTGQQYFSIVYRDGLQNQWLFYADYIIMKKDGTVWVIETKGGESKGKDKNIDIQIENKFNAFKNYATEHSLHWGFVRDKDNQLYINNTEFAHDMVDNHWVPLSQEF